MEVTRDREVALGGWNPQIGAASIEHNVEHLRRSSNRDLSIILSVHIVGQNHSICSSFVSTQQLRSLGHAHSRSIDQLHIKCHLLQRQ
ncbi:hypothetical protein Mapa_008333 [Marchantia paleacea]|nr:hypothetical protein Mapa_008333 [Marchantia paleacea]